MLRSWCIGGPGDDNLYILKVEHTRTGALIYVFGMCRVGVPIWSVTLECSSSCSIDHSFDFLLSFPHEQRAFTFLENP